MVLCISTRQNWWSSWYDNYNLQLQNVTTQTHTHTKAVTNILKPRNRAQVHKLSCQLPNTEGATTTLIGNAIPCSLVQQEWFIYWTIVLLSNSPPGAQFKVSPFVDCDNSCVCFPNIINIVNERLHEKLLMEMFNCKNSASYQWITCENNWTCPIHHHLEKC